MSNLEFKNAQFRMYLIYFWLFCIFSNKIDSCWVKQEKIPDVTKMLGVINIKYFTQNRSKTESKVYGYLCNFKLIYPKKLGPEKN